jgi:hypothetical protein
VVLGVGRHQVHELLFVQNDPHGVLKLDYSERREQKREVLDAAVDVCMMGCESDVGKQILLAAVKD